MLLRLVQKRFGAAVTEQSRGLLDKIEELAVLEELGEGVLDCADSEPLMSLLVAGFRAGIRAGQQLRK